MCWCDLDQPDCGLGIMYVFYKLLAALWHCCWAVCCAHVCGVALTWAQLCLGAVVCEGADWSSCGLLLCGWAQTSGYCVEGWKPFRGVGFKLMFLVCLSLVIQSRVCMLILRQVVCVASVSSVVTARASLPPMCQKHDAASCVSSLWCLRNPPQNSKQAKDLNDGWTKGSKHTLMYSLYWCEAAGLPGWTISSVKTIRSHTW